MDSLYTLYTRMRLFKDEPFFFKIVAKGGMSFDDTRMYYFEYNKVKGKHMYPLKEYGYVVIRKSGDPKSKVHEKPIHRNKDTVTHLSPTGPHGITNEAYIFESEDEMMRDIFMRANLT